ncbi:MAG: ribosomal protein [Anaerophaga sp.]|uniref:50S ribosomal protein L15 n=1 Tax=Anaerophaga thermohalophila TaxID=177400 RepID=UPI000237D171|nr:50S ribosomal protein L15 [Anaerophaga thermohalophila]MBZ4676167.1 ribosomal protein [Anaerophaga sp.]MDI3520225.1 large subunit ribosomal protein [Anaerophaga sp.]MDN5290017.1 large subunit ribosomal protein [Anaerophaga sp.]
MELHNLKPAKGSTHYRRRLGRGPGSGLGGTSTRGHKGAKSRSGYSRKIGFEGGQMPLQRRVPKYGFKNINRKEYKSINVRTIQYLVDKLNVTDFTPEVLYNAGLVGKHDLVKILGDGELKAKVNIKAHAFSKKAREVIEAAQGTAEEL